MLDTPHELSIGVTEFVELLNQTFDFAYPSLLITGELANLRISKNKWVYFDLKDDNSSVKFFGTIYQLPGPLEDGMLLKVRGTPHLHNQYGFSVTVQSIQPTGEGTIKRAAELLQAKLQAEGLFDPARKRSLPYPPRRIGLVASGQSAAYADFIKIINVRFGGLDILHIDVQVQGEIAPSQIIAALQQFNELPVPPDVIVLIRGGGSPEDLAAFSTELVTRAVAASRVPTIVGIGHEVDVCMAELAADRRASTPSNAAELLVPDKAAALIELATIKGQFHAQGRVLLQSSRLDLADALSDLTEIVQDKIADQRSHLKNAHQILEALNPAALLRRGYAIIHQPTGLLKSVGNYDPKLPLQITLSDGILTVEPNHKSISKE